MFIESSVCVAILLEVNACGSQACMYAWHHSQVESSIIIY